MARIHQLHPGQYRSGANIDDDFANILRYLVAAERGSRSLSELMAILFDANGNLIAPLEIRFDGSSGIEYRIGTYAEAEEGWTTIVDIDDIRGPAGTDLGTIEGPLLTGGTAFTATSSQTVFDYAFEATDDLLVFVDGVLQTPTTDYTKDADDDEVTFTSGMTGGEIVYIVKVRASSVSNYRRSDLVSAGQAVFPFVHTDDETLMVYRNGLLQQAGGANDYTTSASSNTVTFTSTIPSADVVTILTVENLASVKVTGLMTEANYTNASGLIPYAKLSIADNDIPQAKVNGLATLLTNRGRMYVTGTEPVSPSAGDIWLDTSVTPNKPYIYDSTQFLEFAPTTSLPSFTVANRDQILHINSTGTGLQWKSVDLSAYAPLTLIGAANGIASLDSSGRLPTSQLPTTLTLDTLYTKLASTVSNGNYVIKRIYKEKVRIDARALRLSAGTCNWTLQVDGVDVAGTGVAVTTTPSEANLASSVSVDATSASKTIGFKVDSVSSAADLDVALAVARESI